MLGEIVDFGPLASGLLAPYQDAAVEAGGGEEGAEFWVGPGHAPDGAVVAFERLAEHVLVVFHFEDFYAAVGGAGREAAAVVVEYGIVL
jgi:hypothetical protein